MSADPIREDIKAMLAELKRIFRSKGITYRWIAQRLGTCEKTVKRYMSGKGLKLDALSDLCHAAGLTILDLAEMVNKRRGNRSYLSEHQENQLDHDLFTGLIFTLLRRGWDPDVLSGALRADPADITASLVKLDRIGVIELHPGNRVKVLATVMSGSVAPRRSGYRTVKKVTFASMREMMETDHPEMIWRMSIVRLTPARLAEVGKLFDELLERMLVMESKDLTESDATWYQGPLMLWRASDHFFQNLKPA